MTIPRWNPPDELTAYEKLLMKRHKRSRKLFAFLRTYRLEIFNEAFQDELIAMYRDTGAGHSPLPPAMMGMAMLLQGYMQVSDAESVELSMVDLRWQLVLGCLGQQQPAFSQGAFSDFRHRVIRHDMDRRILERTAEVAKSTGAFDARKLPKELRLALDSSPLEGAGRVEDALNLLAHAGRNVLRCAAALVKRSPAWVAEQAGAEMLVDSSIKKALDIDWSDKTAKAEAAERVAVQLDALEQWIRHQLADELKRPPLSDELQTLQQLRDQELEPDPDGGGTRRIRKGVPAERRISVEDPEMRHGRKSSSTRVDGYKRHIARDLDAKLILAADVTPANRPEAEAAEGLCEDAERTAERPISELYIDRGYISSPVVASLLNEGAEVFCKPWAPHNGGLFTKQDFDIDLEAEVITCPAGHQETFVLPTTVVFPGETCQACPLKAQCTKVQAHTGKGRSVMLGEDEPQQQVFRELIATPQGRETLRERVPVEHNLAHIGYRQGRRARYLGTRNNVFDLRRASAIQNLETIQRELQREAA